MRELFQEFQLNLAEGKIKATNKNFDKVISNMSFYLISSDNTNQLDIQNINRHINKTKITIIREIQKTGKNYFVLCFDQILLIIESIKLVLIETFFTANKESSIYFLEDSRNNFQNYIKIDDLKTFEETETFQFEIERFKFDIRKIAGTHVTSFWYIVKKVISGYFIQKGYIGFCQNRIKDIVILNRKNNECPIHNENDYIFLRNIDNSVNIQLCYSIHDEQLYAIKIPDIDIEADKLQTREMKNYMSLSHPFLPQYFGFFEESKRKKLVIEYIQGNTIYNIRENIQNKLSDEMKIKAIFQIMIAIEFLHNNHFIYRDLKPNNVIIDKNGTLVLIDLDRMITYECLVENMNNNKLTCDFQSPCAAPEFNFYQASYASDIYSIGILASYIITGKYPKQDSNKGVVFKNHFDEFPEKFSKLKTLCEKCSAYNPQERPSISEIIDSFYRDYFSYVHTHGLKIADDDFYLQDFSEIKSIESTLNIHSLEYSKYWILISEYDNAYSQVQLSLIYINGNLFPQDYIKSCIYFMRSNKAESRVIQYKIGEMYFKKIGKDIKKAIYFYTLSADNNYPLAQLFIGTKYFEGLHIKYDINKAIHYLTLAADNNQIEAMYFLGEIYEYNIKDINKAIYYYTLAADKNHEMGQYKVGLLYLNDVYFPHDLNKAIKYLNMASSNNNSEAQFLLGCLYEDKVLLKQDIDKSLHYFNLSANNNNFKAQLMIGFCYKEGKYLPQDLNKAFEYISKSAQQNYPNGQYHLGLIYLDSKLPYYDLNKALFYLTTAAKSGYVLAQNKLGSIYMDFKMPFCDIKKAIFYYDLASKQNHLQSQFTLGTIYLDGKLIQKDIYKAIHYLTLAANQNNPDALFNLGIIYKNEDKSLFDMNKSFYYLNRAAELNSKEAQYFLGGLYLEGKFLPKDINKSIHYLKQAASNNHSQSLYFLGLLFSEGIEIGKDINKAIYYYSLASDQNNTDAQVNLGEIYYNGYDVPKDYTRAIYYWTLAAETNPEAQYNLGVNYHLNQKHFDIKKSMHYYLLAANQNHKKAQYNLGLLYYEGKLIPRDLQKAFYYFERSAILHYPYALHNLGCMYLEGEYISKDVNKCIHYLTLAANQNDSNSQYMLGVIYCESKNYLPNVTNRSDLIQRGIEYLELSAKNSNRGAIFYLACLYHQGEKVKKNMDKAISYYKSNSSLDDEKAKNNLAIIYKNGDGVNKNISMTIELLQEAIKKKKDPISMLNLAKIYYFGEDIKEDLDRSIDLLLESSKIEMKYSSIFLCFVLLKKLGSQFNNDNVQKELIKHNYHNMILVNQIKKYFFERKFENAYHNHIVLQFSHDTDFCYDETTNFHVVDKYGKILKDFELPENEEKEEIEEINRVEINEKFYEGFGL